MKRIALSSLVVTLTALCGSLLVLSCRGDDQDRAAAAATTAEWKTIESERAALDLLRAQLAAARSAQPPVEARIDDLEVRVGIATDQFLERLVGFINEHARPAAGSGATVRPEIEAAIHTKSAEDLLVAREHIDGAGDYAKAIDILAGARAIDPDNQELAAAQAEAERLRYVDEESFGRVEKGMREDEVRAEIGQVKPQNVRPSPDGQVVWLYPREGGAAAAVFFQAGRGGALEVFETNFEAVATAAERAAEGDGRAESAAD